MISFGQFAKQMERAVRESPHAIQAALQVTMESVKVEAKGYIGHEIPEWKPLSSATMQGFRHPAGFYIPGKTELGYTGRVSATDPLLRTGAMRAGIESAVVGNVGVVGSKDKKALFQEMGTVNPRTGSIPPRPFLGLAISRAKPQAEIFFGRAAKVLLTTGGRATG